MGTPQPTGWLTLWSFSSSQNEGAPFLRALCARVGAHNARTTRAYIPILEVEKIAAMLGSVEERESEGGLSEPSLLEPS